MQDQIRELLRALERKLKPLGRVLVAFSGGVDSTLLASVARNCLGKNLVLAVTGESASMARMDLKRTRNLCRVLDIEHRVIQTSELEQVSYRSNTPIRCYVCRFTLFRELSELAQKEAYQAILYGAIVDDLKESRPGSSAARALRVRAPLQELGITKGQVRELARALKLPNWDLPQNACLSSRVPWGQPIDQEALKRVELAEEGIRKRGFRQVRVRLIGNRARIEVGVDELYRMKEADFRQEIERFVVKCGFSYAQVDPKGYRRSGGVIENQVD